jgi:Mor family transcriptional regulator
MPAPPCRRVTAADRVRIFARMQEGWSYEAIAQEERLSRKRVRQIVKKTLDERLA